MRSEASTFLYEDVHLTPLDDAGAVFIKLIEAGYEVGIEVSLRELICFWESVLNKFVGLFLVK